MGCGESKSAGAVQNKVDINKLISEKPQSARRTPRLEQAAQKTSAQQTKPAQTGPTEAKKEIAKTSPTNQQEKTPKQEPKREEAASPNQAQVTAPAKAQELSVKSEANPSELAVDQENNHGEGGETQAAQQSASRNRSTSFQQAQVHSGAAQRSQTAETTPQVDETPAQLEQTKVVVEAALIESQPQVVEVEQEAVREAAISNPQIEEQKRLDSEERKPEQISAQIELCEEAQTPTKSEIQSPAADERASQNHEQLVTPESPKIDQQVEISDRLAEEERESQRQDATAAVSAGSGLASASEEQDAADNDNLDSSQQDGPEHQVVPKVESLIQYQEVMESTPEDAVLLEQKQADERNSISSAEPPVADERVAFENLELEEHHQRTNSSSQQYQYEHELADLQAEVNLAPVQLQAALVGDAGAVKSQQSERESLQTVLTPSDAHSQSAETLQPVQDLIDNEIMEELSRQSLSQVITVEAEGKTVLDPDYYLRLINSSVLFAEQQIKTQLDGAVEKRRAAFQRSDWPEYSQIVAQMQTMRENKSAEIQEKICDLLSLSDDQFLSAADQLLQNNRAEELSIAQQGQLVDIQSIGESDSAEKAPLTEDQTLQIFEIMLRSRLEQQTLLQEKVSENASDEDLSNLVIVHNVKAIDQIYFQFGVEFKQFNWAVKHYADTSTTFETRMIEKEEEIMDCSV